ncbi:MAG: hypothetical protein WED34_08060 [Planctomycetales bacterium]
MLRTFTAARCAGLLAAGFVLAMAMASDASAASRPKKFVVKPTFDPTAEQVDLFEAAEKGAIDVKVIPKDSTGGNVLIENKTDQPLSVKLPDAFVGVQVLKQGLIGGGGIGLGPGGIGGGYGATGGAQPLGGLLGGLGGGIGGLGGGLGGLGGLGGIGGGLFSIPPEQVARIPFRSVCLAHGKPDPTSRMTYRMVPVESFSDDATLPQLIRLLADPKVDQHALQAATWHITDGMSWQQLATKQVEQLGGGLPRPYFSLAHLQYAQQALAVAHQHAEEAQQAKPAQPVRPQPAAPNETPSVRRPLASGGSR